MTHYLRVVKPFLSLFSVMYILPAGKSISPLKGLKSASLKILSPLLRPLSLALYHGGARGLTDGVFVNSFGGICILENSLIKYICFDVILPKQSTFGLLPTREKRLSNGGVVTTFGEPSAVSGQRSPPLLHTLPHTFTS
jgi:hypothetical protein